MKHLKVTLEFLEPILGSSPADSDIYRTYIGSKAPDAKTIEDEVQDLGVEEVADSKMTIFQKKDGKPILRAYQIRGFFKGTCGFLRKIKTEECAKESAKISAYKKLIDGCIFVEPSVIPIEMHSGNLGICSRPLRASTPQGERVALASSEEAPVGSTITFVVICPDQYEAAVREWLDYGLYSGMGQWMNSGKGRFEVRSIEAI